MVNVFTVQETWVLSSIEVSLSYQMFQVLKWATSEKDNDSDDSALNKR